MTSYNHMARYYLPQILSRFDELAAALTERDTNKPDEFSQRLDGANIDANTRELLENLAFEGKLIRPTKQIHSDNIAVITDANQLIPSTVSDIIVHPTLFPEGCDGIISTLPGFLAGMSVADCTANLIYDPNHKVYAAIHSGWRGTKAEIIPKAIEIMKDQFKTSPAELIVYMAPGAGPASYEVGPEVAEQFDEKFIQTHGEGKFLLDVSSIVLDQFLTAGVKPENIETDRRDTMAQTDVLFSARTDGDGPETPSGRMLGAIGLRPKNLPS
jgi:YfiH family protein